MMDQLAHFFLSQAYAGDAVPATPPQGGGMSFVVMFFIFFLFIYFAIWRPQNKRAKEQQQLLNSLAKGDEVVSAGGILGRINKVSDQYIALSVGNNVEITMQKSAIVSLLPKGTIKSLE